MTTSKMLGLALGAALMLGFTGLAAAQDGAIDPNGPVAITPRQGVDPEAPGARPLFGPGSDGKIHGEIGAGIGTHGYREAYGTVAIPLGDHAGLVVSFDSYKINAPSGRRWYNY